MNDVILSLLCSDGTKRAIKINGNGDVFILGIGGYDGVNEDKALTLQEVLKNLNNIEKSCNVVGSILIIYKNASISNDMLIINEDNIIFN